MQDGLGGLDDEEDLEAMLSATLGDGGVEDLGEADMSAYFGGAFPPLPPLPWPRACASVCVKEERGAWWVEWGGVGDNGLGGWPVGRGGGGEGGVGGSAV